MKGYLSLNEIEIKNYFRGKEALSLLHDYTQDLRNRVKHGSDSEAELYEKAYDLLWNYFKEYGIDPYEE